MRLVAFVAAVAAVAILAPGAVASTTVEFTTKLTDDRATPNGFTVTEDVFRSGKKVGTARAVCRFYPAGSDQPTGANCNITVSLPAGTIRIFGKLPFDVSRGHLKVIGGTGKFAGASGTGTYRALSSWRTAVTLHID